MLLNYIIPLKYKKNTLKFKLNFTVILSQSFCSCIINCTNYAHLIIYNYHILVGVAFHDILRDTLRYFTTSSSRVYIIILSCRLSRISYRSLEILTKRLRGRTLSCIITYSIITS